MERAGRTLPGQEERRVTMSPSTCRKEQGRGTILPGYKEGIVTKCPYEGMKGRVRAPCQGRKKTRGNYTDTRDGRSKGTCARTRGGE
jgi:hypothetical protein